VVLRGVDRLFRPRVKSETALPQLSLERPEDRPGAVSFWQKSYSLDVGAPRPQKKTGA